MPLRKSISAVHPIFRIFDTSMILRIVPSGLLLLKVRLSLKPTTSATSSVSSWMVMSSPQPMLISGGCSLLRVREIM